MNYDSKENQKIKGNFISREVFCCVTDLVEYIISKSYEEKDRRIPFTYEDIENLYYTEEDAEEFEVEEGEEKEVYEWWIVSSLLGRKLREREEVIIKNGNNWYWGRSCTGQAILLDSVISSICEELGLLQHENAV